MPMSAWPSTPAEKLTRLFRGFWVSQAIHVAAQLELADLVADGPRSVEDLASAAGAHAPTLRRVLRLLAGEGVFAEAEDGRFELTPMAAALQRDNGQLRLQVLFVGRAVAGGARGAVAAAGLVGGCEAVGGDFFKAVPAGGDAYLVKFILHDWDDERSVAILRTCRSAIPAGGRLLVVEFVIGRGNEPSFATTQDMNMLINLGGQERTEAEYRALFEASGFALTRTIPVFGDMRIVEGVPAAG